MALSLDVFRLAARLGSLEGYLYERRDVEVSSLPNWVENIEREYRALPAAVQAEVRGELVQVLRNVARSMAGAVDDGNPALASTHRLLAELEQGG
ncbi:MAG: hypothetical protein HYY85_20015 [Deltaproteobacteria bacterium]|nr:hypothetical protein [Deltaproteobacteria bacterium]